MDKRNEYRLTLLKKMYNVGVEHKEVIDLNPVTRMMFDKIIEYIQLATDYVSEADVSIKALWHDKNEAIDILIKTVVRDTKALRGFGRFNKFNKFADLANFNKTDLESMSDEELIGHVRMLIELILANDAESKLAGISNDRFDVLNAALIKVEKLSEQPESARTQIKLTNQDLDNTLKEFGKLMIALTGHMEGVYEGVNHSFYDAFVIAKNVTKPYSHKLSMSGHITDENGDPLRYVRISIDGGDDIIKKSKKGGYTFKNLLPGKHVLVFKRAGYITQTHVVDILPLKTLILDIQLEPVVSPATDVESNMEVEAN